VQLVGYGHDDDFDKDYWIMRNSWGSTWGIQGFMHLERHDPTGPSGPYCGKPVPNIVTTTQHFKLTSFSLFLLVVVLVLLLGLDIYPLDGTGCDGGPGTLNVCGSCGVLWDVSYPIGGSVPSTK